MPRRHLGEETFRQEWPAAPTCLGTLAGDAQAVFGMKRNATPLLQ